MTMLSCANLQRSHHLIEYRTTVSSDAFILCYVLTLRHVLTCFGLACTVKQNHRIRFNQSTSTFSKPFRFSINLHLQTFLKSKSSERFSTPKTFNQIRLIQRRICTSLIRFVLFVGIHSWSRM